MLLRLFLLIAFYYLCSYNNCKADIVYNKTVGSSDCYDEAFSLIPFANGYLSTVTQLCPSGSNQREGAWLYLDENGDSTELDFNPYSGFIKVLQNNNLLIYGGNQAGLVYDTVFLHRINENGQKIWSSKSYIGNCSNNVYSIAESNGDLLVAGTYKVNNCNTALFESYLLKVKANGQQSWSQTYTGNFNSLQFYDVRSSDSSIYIAGFGDSSNVNRSGYFAALDSNGNILWQKKIQKPGKDVNAYSIEQLGNKLYILAYDDSVRLYISDLNGNIKAEKNLGARCGSPYFHIEQSLDGFLIVLANENIDAECTSTLSKVDSSGSLIWKKQFSGVIRSFHEADSGSFLLSGYVDFLPQAKLVRFDTTFVSIAPPTSVTEKEFQSFIIYPNPCSGTFSIAGKNDILSVRLYNSNGQLLHFWGQFSESFYTLPNNLQAGVYFLQIEDQQENISHRKLMVL